MAYLDHIKACNAHDIARFRPFVVAGRQMGWVTASFCLRLAAFPDVFFIHDDRVILKDTLTTPDDRTAAVGRVLAALVAEGCLPKLRGELYPVATGFGQPPVMCIDRGAVAQFGIRAYGIHVNGFVRTEHGLSLWIGRRALDKSVAPGKLDNLVAGGQPVGLSLSDNLIKEAAEEADIPRALALTAKPVGAITYCMETGNGLKPDVLFCYDLELPHDFTPRNTDGELSGFTLMPVSEVAGMVRTTDEFKFNVNLVIIDFLIRHGLLSPDTEPDYLHLVNGLRSPLPSGNTN